jgi:hypothetical protein
MSTEPSDVGTLADAVVTGRTVDWQAAESLADTAEVCRIVRELGVLATLANVYRADVEETVAGPPITRWGRFESLTAIGSGANATVYKARHKIMNRLGAIKIISASLVANSRAVERFHREVQAAAKLHHPNIVPVYAVGADRGVHYYAMQFIDGQTLSANDAKDPEIIQLRAIRRTGEAAPQRGHRARVRPQGRRRLGLTGAIMPRYLWLRIAIVLAVMVGASITAVK